MTTTTYTGRFGAELRRAGGARVQLYAPGAQRARLVYRTAADPGDTVRNVELARSPEGFFSAEVAEMSVGSRYGFRLDDNDLTVPDPASRYQPDGVHGLSEVIDPASFTWPDDGWQGLAWNEHVFYELHVGTFSPEGTYAGAAAKLDELVELGITAVELMPLADVPGARNWGYDGVLLYAPSHNYGRPDDLRAFIAAAHAKGLAVFLDVVYNHFGPEGNYLPSYAPNFFTERHKTPWGAAIDYSSAGNDPVRAFFIENAVYWLDEYRFDGLRLDAVHAIYDDRPKKFLEELAATVDERLGGTRKIALVLENDESQASLLRAGFRAQWNDDVHHAGHVLLTGQRDGYYSDYADRPVARLGRALTSGFAYQGEPSKFRGGNKRGESSVELELGSFVNFIQNHDQIGNRPFGDRIGSLTSDEALRAILAVLLLAPSPPMLFMGEEWHASTPFLFFCDFEPELARLVTEGRRGEFGSFAEFANPQARERIPDPAAESTFTASTLNWSERDEPGHRAWLEYYRLLLGVRKREIAPRIAGLRGTSATFDESDPATLNAQWDLPTGERLSVAANLAAQPGAPFTTLDSATRLLFATHEHSQAEAPPWSVRWSLK